MTDPKELKVVFAEGCFDDFEGTQEELQELIAMIHQMAADGTMLEQSKPLDPEGEEEFIKMMQDKMSPRQ